MSTTILCYERCTTCKKALKWMDDNGYEYINRPIKEKNPSAAELKKWWKKSGLPLKRFFNTSGDMYRKLELKDKLLSMSEEEQLELLATDGMIVKRPLLVTDKGVFPGFRENEWEELLG